MSECQALIERLRIGPIDKELQLKVRDLLERYDKALEDIQEYADTSSHPHCTVIWDIAKQAREEN